MLDTAVIPCGGRGSRLHPITRWAPKDILPVGLRPIRSWTRDEAADAGLPRAIVVTTGDSFPGGMLEEFEAGPGLPPGAELYRDAVTAFPPCV